MRTAHRTIALAVAVTVLAFIGAGAALAANPQMRPQQVPPVQGTPATCNALAAAASQLQQARQQLVTGIAAVRQRLLAGGLTARQRAVAQAQLALLGFGLRLVDTMLARVQTRQAQLCSSDSGSPPPPPPPPPEEEEGGE